MRLYHHPFSSNSRRAVVTALHLGAPVELVVVDLAKGEQRNPEFLRINPNGRVPALDDDGFVLWESHAIMQYLADKTPGQTLYPQGVRERADVNRWLFWCSHHFAPAVGILNFERFIKRLTGRGDPDPQMIARGEEQFAASARVLDAHLHGRQWVAQDRLTLADISLAAPLMSAGPAQLPLGPYEHVARWFAKIQELDAWKKTNPAR